MKIIGKICLGSMALILVSGGSFGFYFWKRKKTAPVPTDHNLSKQADLSKQCETDFPFLDHYQPFKQGEVAFQAVNHTPSFLHPNGQWVAMPKSTGGFELWDWLDGIPIRSMGGSHRGEKPREHCENSAWHPGAFSKDGKTWVWGHSWSGGDSGNELFGEVWETGKNWNSGYCYRPLFSPMQNQIFIASSYEEPVQINTLTGETKSFEPVKGIFKQSRRAFSPDCRFLACEHPGGWIAIWSIPKGACRAFIRCPDAGNFSFGPDGSSLFSDRHGEWKWHTESVWIESNQTDAQKMAVNCDQYWLTEGKEESFGPSKVLAGDGKFELTRRGEGIIDIRTRSDQKLVRRLVAFAPNTNLVAFGAKDHQLLASAPAGVPWLWNPEAPIRKIAAEIQDFLHRPGVTSLPAQETRALAWSKDGKWLSVGASNGAIQIYASSRLRSPDGTLADERTPNRAEATLKDLTGSIRAMAFSNHHLAAITLDGQVAVWDRKKGNLIKAWKAHGARANTLQIASDGSWMLTGGLDGISLWSLPDGKQIRRLNTEAFGVSCLSLSPDEKQVAACFFDGKIAVYECPSGKLRWKKEGHTDVAASVAIHPSGKWLVSLGWDNKIRAWDLAQGNPKEKIERDAPEASSCLIWHADGKRLAVGGNAGVTILDEGLNTIQTDQCHLDFFWDEDCT